MAYRTLSFSRRLANRFLTAACLAAALGLTACDAAIETAREAQRDAQRAARIAASAGQPRATDELLDKVADTPLADRQDLHTQLGGIAPTRTQSAEKDLLEANTLITKALQSELTSSVKASLQAQAAAISLQLATQRFNDLQPRIAEIARRAVTLQRLAQLAIDFGSEATALSAGVKPPTSEEVDKARAAAAATTAEVTRAQAEVERLQREIASRQEQARDIYSRSQAAFQQADTLKGKEAIDAAKAAIEESKKGDVLMAEAGNLETALTKARGDLAVAQINARDAERQVTTATAAFEAGNTWITQNTTRITSLQAQSKKAVSDAGNLTEQYNQLVKLVAELDPALQSAAEAAEQARMHYGAALSTHTSVTRDLSTKLSENETPPDDPLVKLSRDARGAALLSWAQAAAAEQAGRIQAAGYNAANLASGLKGVVDAAHKAAGAPAPSVALPDKAPYQTKATEAFTAAVDAAKAGTDQSSPGLDNIKWIGWALQAVANQGLATVAPDNAQRTRFTTEARAAATAATKTTEPTDHGNPDVAPLLRRAGIDVAG